MHSLEKNKSNTNNEEILDIQELEIESDNDNYIIEETLEIPELVKAEATSNIVDTSKTSLLEGDAVKDGVEKNEKIGLLKTILTESLTKSNLHYSSECTIKELLQSFTHEENRENCKICKYYGIIGEEVIENHSK